MKRTFLYQLFVVFVLSLAFIACDTRQDRDDTVDDRGTDTYTPGTEDNTGMRTETEEDFIFFDDSKDYTFEDRVQFNQDVQTARTRLNQEITQLESRIQNVTGEQKEEYREKLNDLKDKRDEVDKEMKEYNRVTSDTWDEFKGDVTTALTNAEDSYKDIRDDISDEVDDINDNMR